MLYTVEPRYKNIIGNHLCILIREVFLYKGNSLFWLEKSSSDEPESSYVV